MRLVQLSHHSIAFPSPDAALREPNGLLVLGGDLSPSRLLMAYQHGIFPWYSPGDPILWWSPDPRTVFRTDAVHLSHRFRRALRRSDWVVRADQAFAEVMHACASTPRPGQDGTWISEEMIAAYCELHRLGWAHSAETWLDDELVGGLYGLWIGRVFFGESMFSWQNNASKFALAHWVAHLRAEHCGLIDCQMHTAHLASLGAREISGTQFQHLLQTLIG